VVHKVSAARTGPITKFNYLSPMIESLRRFEPPVLTIEADGRRIFGPAPGFVMVANAAEYGAGFSLTPAARTDDGLLDVRTLLLPTRRRLLSSFAKSAMGIVESQPIRAKHVRIHSEVPVPLQIDGDPAGHSPAEIRVLDAKLRLLTPSSNARA